MSDNYIFKLNELKTKLAALLVECQPLGPDYAKTQASLPKNEPIVIFLHGTELGVGFRRCKPEGSVEAVRISKLDATDSPTPSRFNKYLVKLAAFLERRGMYQPRNAYSDKTGDLFQEIPK